jgi:hypothetical protein
MPRNPTPRRIGLVSLVAALLLSAGFAFACKRDSTSTEDLPQGIETRAVATDLPAGATVVVSGYDLHAFWTRLQATQLYKELAAIQGVREAFSPIAGARGEFEAETGLALDEATVMNLLGNKFDLGFYGSLPEDRADILLLAEVEDEAAARPILEGLEGRVARERGATFSDLEVAGRTVRMAADAEGDEVLLYTLEDGRLVMSSTRARLEQALGDGEETRTMTDVEEYLDILEKLPEATITVWVDQRAIAEASRAAMDADTTAARTPGAAAASALEEYNVVRDFGVGIFWTEAGIRSDVFTRFLSDRRPELAEMMTRPPSEVRSIAFQPLGTILYTAFNTFDPGLVYRQLTEYAVDATRIQMDVQGTADSMRADSLVRSNIAAFERETGLDIEEDLLSWVGEEVSFSITGVDRSGFFPVPEFAFAVASKDQGRANAFFQKAETLLADAARDRASMPVSWQAEEHEGQTIRFAPTPVGEGLSISYVVTSDFALVASKPALVRQMLDARTGRAEGLPSNPGFGALTTFYPQQVNGIGYVNLEELLTQIEGLMGTFGPMTGASPDSASTANQVLKALKNAPRLGAYAQAEGDEGLRTHILLEVR